MAEKAFLDGEGLQQTVEWLRNKDVGEYTDDTRTNEIFNDYYNNIAKGTYNHAEGCQTKALGAYNHAEGYGTSAGSYQDAYFRYCGNPILQVQSGTSVINKVSIDSDTYQIYGKTGTFLLDTIDLPEDFKVGKYSSTLKILDYDYIFNDNKWYDLSNTNIELTEELNSLFSVLFNDNTTINRKIYQVSEEPTDISNDLYIYNGAIYCSAFTDNKIEVSAETITTLTTINTLESQTNGYITTLYVNESNSFGFIYYFIDDDLILYKQQYDVEYTIENLTNNYGTFKKIDQIYQAAPTVITQAGVVCGTSYNSSAMPQYSGNSGKWEYLNEYNVILSITESDRIIYDDEGNPTGEVNPSLIVTYNAEDLINKTVDFNTDNINFVYSKTITEEEATLDWYLNDTIVDLTDYGISVENPQEYDIITFDLNRFYISYDSDGNQVEKNQEEFYTDNHASGTTSYVFNGTASGNWVKTVQNGDIDNSDSCHAEGHGSIATGKYSHAEGLYTKASGEASHAEGYQTIVTGPDSHTEGIQTQVAGSGCHAEGLQTKIHAGTANHVEGLGTSIADGTANHAEGYGNEINMPGAGNHVEGYGNEINDQGDGRHAEGYQNEIIGCNYSHVEGQGNIISKGAASHAEGYTNRVYSSYGHVEGFGNIAGKKEENSYTIATHAEGYETKALADYSHSEGQQTTASGGASHAEGLNTQALGIYSHAEGQNTIAQGGSSHTEGLHTQANGWGSHAGGNSCKAYADNSFASGLNSETSGECAHAMGNFANAAGHSSFACNNNTNASGNNSFASGYLTVAAGDTSHAEGICTIASAVGSHAQNLYTVAKYNYNTTIGKYNEKDKDLALAVGNGTSDTTRSNALELDWEGNLKASGDIINGNGVVVGAYISNEKIDEIWNSIFEEGRVCLVQTSS